MFSIRLMSRRRGCAPLPLVLALLIAVMVGSPAPAGAQDETPTRKMSRQVSVLEKVLDQVLIDSPNFLVPGRNNARGIFLDEFGALLTFEASLVSKNRMSMGFEFDWPIGYRIEENERGDKVIVIPKRHVDEDSDNRTPRTSAEARLYERGKVELRETLLDYGDTITALDDAHWIAIAAYLKDHDYFVSERISRLVIRVRMRDIRAYAAGKIDEKTVLSRFQETEY